MHCKPATVESLTFAHLLVRLAKKSLRLGLALGLEAGDGFGLQGSLACVTPLEAAI